MDNFNQVTVKLKEIIQENSDFFDIIAELKKQKKKSDEVRFVFWFDN